MQVSSSTDLSIWIILLVTEEVSLSHTSHFSAFHSSLMTKKTPHYPDLDLAGSFTDSLQLSKQDTNADTLFQALCPIPESRTVAASAMFYSCERKGRLPL